MRKPGDFREVPMDRMEMYDLLAKIYLKTCIRFEHIGIVSLIKEQGGTTIRGKKLCISAALSLMGLLLTEGKTRGVRYKWNMKKYGPVSLAIADMVIEETIKVRRRKDNLHARRRYAREKGII